MNRSVTLVGVAIFLFTVVLVAFPIAFTGHEVFDLEQEAGLVGIPIGLLIVLFGAASADPRVTTVGGAFGNPDENVVRRQLGPNSAGRARFLPGPREAVNCRYCYTAIPSSAAVCPRCARPRECRSCGRPLAFIGAAIRCPQCRRDEVYCNCPRVRQVQIGGTGRVARRL